MSYLKALVLSAVVALAIVFMIQNITREPPPGHPP